MAIKTADQLDPEKLRAYLNGDVKLERKIIGLSSQTILVSEGVLELLNNAQAKKILVPLFTNGRLREIGASLQQQSLDSLLHDLATEAFKDQLEGLPEDVKIKPDDSIASILRALDIDMDLRIKTEMPEVNRELQKEIPTLGSPTQHFIIIATSDEADVAAGALMVIQRQTALTTAEMLNPMSYLKSEEGQRRIKTMVEEKFISVLNDMLELPTTSDPTEFEARLRRLSFSPVLQQGNNEEQFIQMSVANFHRRPAHSRAVVAEVLKHHGQDHLLMDSVIFPSDPSLPASRKVEAISSIVKQLDRIHDPTDLLIAATSIVKTLEEETAAEAQVRAMQVLAQKAQRINQSLPEFFLQGRVTFLIKNRIVDAPETFLLPAMSLLQALCLSVAETRNEMADELDAVDNPFLIYAYCQVLDDTAKENWPERLFIAEKQWRLYLRLTRDEPKQPEKNLAERLRRRFIMLLPESLQLLGNVIGNEFKVDERVMILRTLDEVFAELVGSTQEVHLPSIANFLLDQIGEDVATPEEEAFLWKTRALFYPKLPEKYLAKLWQQIEPRLSRLANDENFRKRFEDLHSRLLPELIEYLGDNDDERTRARMLPVAYNKTGSQQLLGRTESMNQHVSQTLPRLGELALGEMRDEAKSFEPHRSGFEAVLVNPCLPSLEFTRLLAAFNHECGEQLRFDKARFSLLANVAANRHMNDEFASNFFEEFLSAVKSEMPGLPKSIGDIITLTNKVEIGMVGITHLLENSIVPNKTKKRMRAQLNKLLDNRPERKIEAHRDEETKKMVPTTVLPDPIRDWLLKTLA